MSEDVLEIAGGHHFLPAVVNLLHETCQRMSIRSVRQRCFAVAGCVIATWIFAAQPAKAAPGVVYDRIGLAGEPVFGIGAGHTLGGLINHPLMTQSDGDVLIAAGLSLTGPGVTDANNKVLILASAAGHQVVAREGDQPPGMPVGSAYSDFPSPSPLAPYYWHKDSGNSAAFRATVTTTSGPTNTGLWLVRNNGVHLVSATGAAIAGLPGMTFDFAPTAFALAGDGPLAFETSLAGASVTPDNNGAIVVGDHLNMAIAAREGQPAPGIAPASTYRTLHRPHVNESGKIAFFGTAAQVGAPASVTSGLWAGPAGSLQSVAIEGAAAPGLPGVSFGKLYEDAQLFSATPPAINANGDVAFSAQLEGAGVSGSNNESVWITQGASPVLVARSGDPAPGLPPSTVFASVGGGARLDNLGRTVVGATLAGPGVTTTNAASLWFGSPGNLSLVVRQGMRIPNNSSEIWFGGPTLRVLAMNESGDLFISASLVGNAFTGSIRSFWMYTDGELQLLAAEGTSYDSNPDPTEADYARIFEDGIVGPGLIGSPYIATLSNSGLAAFRTFSHTSPSGGLLTARVVDTSAGAADFNHDGAVDAHDLVVWREGFPVSNDRASPTIGDANYDGDVDGADFLAWQRRLDASSSQMAALPEPTSLYLGAAAILAVTRLMAVCIRRRR